MLRKKIEAGGELRGGAGPEEIPEGRLAVHGDQLRLELKAAAGERDFTCARHSALGTEFTEIFILKMLEQMLKKF